MFPEGIPVGVIERLEDSEDGQSYSAQVKLFVDFSEIDNVYIVSNDNIDEQNGLEKKIEKQ
jgi:cell shape-determining protein MreC